MKGFQRTAKGTTGFLADRPPGTAAGALQREIQSQETATRKGSRTKRGSCGQKVDAGVQGRVHHLPRRGAVIPKPDEG